jgi:hypothetical protein
MGATKLSPTRFRRNLRETSRPPRELIPLLLARRIFREERARRRILYSRDAFNPGPSWEGPSRLNEVVCDRDWCSFRPHQLGFVGQLFHEGGGGDHFGGNAHSGESLSRPSPALPN